VDSNTYVFGGKDGGWFKMARVDATGRHRESRYTKAVSSISQLTVAVWNAARRGGSYKVEDVVCSGSSARADALNWDEFEVADPMEPSTWGEWYQAHYHGLVVVLLAMSLVLCGVALCVSARRKPKEYAMVPSHLDTDSEVPEKSESECDEEQPINE
jgi:hypothetical protein